jgi:hypothetical protein
VKRALSICVVLAFACSASGCASSSGRTVARNVLIALAVGSAAVAVGSAVKSHGIEQDLQRDVNAGTVSGRDYVSRDQAGARWNRIARASAFGTALFVTGLAVVWETSASAHIQNSPAEKTPADDPHPIFPLPGQAPTR